MDGDKNRNYGKGMTHTIENKPNPWWEIDLGSAQQVDAISLWSRRGFSDRLGDFTLQLLDALVLGDVVEDGHGTD